MVTDPVVMELYERRLVLVRPDGHVAWRANVVPSDAGALIEKCAARNVETHTIAGPSVNRPSS